MWSSIPLLLFQFVVLINFLIPFSFVTVQAFYEFLNVRDGIGLCSSVSTSTVCGEVNIQTPE